MRLSSFRSFLVSACVARVFNIFIFFFFIISLLPVVHTRHSLVAPLSTTLVLLSKKKSPMSTQMQNNIVSPIFILFVCLLKYRSVDLHHSSPHSLRSDWWNPYYAPDQQVLSQYLSSHHPLLSPLGCVLLLLFFVCYFRQADPHSASSSVSCAIRC